MKVNHKTFSGGYKFSSFEGQPSGTVSPFTYEGNVADWTIKAGNGVKASDVLEALGRTGFEGPQTALVPTEGTIAPALVKDIIINAVEVEPYDLPATMLVNEGNINRFTEGLKAIRESYREAKVTLVIGENQETLGKRLFPLAENLSWLEKATITAKYPANFKEVQSQAVLNKKYPVGYAPAHIGLVFLSVQDVLTVATVVSEHKDAATKYVALSGTGWKENKVIEVALGTPIKAITDAYLDDGEARLIKNSVIMGDILTEASVITYDLDTLVAIPEDRRRQTLFFFRAGAKVDSFSNAFLGKLLPKVEKTAETNLHGERRTCIACGYCENVCPAGLVPHLLHKHVNRDIINERLAEYKLFDCIECGLCDYVCPSKIDLSTDIIKGKEALEKAEISHNTYLIPQCDMLLEPTVEKVVTDVE